MTARNTTRRRRNSGTTQIPKSIAEWFAGERRFTFYAYTAPYQFVLREYWQAWLQDHPGAVPPHGLETRLREPAPGSLRAALEHKARISLGLTQTKDQP